MSRFCLSFLLQGHIFPSLVVSCCCSKGQIFITCSINSTWSSCMLQVYPVKFNLSTAHDTSYLMRLLPEISFSKLLIMTWLHSSMNSGHRFMRSWRHHCLLLLNYYSVYISREDMVNDQSCWGFFLISETKCALGLKMIFSFIIILKIFLLFWPSAYMLLV